MIKLPCGACVKKKIVPAISGGLAVTVEFKEPKHGLKLLSVKIPPQGEMTKEEITSLISEKVDEELASIGNYRRQSESQLRQRNNLIEVAEQFNKLLELT